MLDEPVVVGRRRIPGPREGWLSVVLMAVMLLSLCWAVQAAGWLELADFLIPVAIWALVTGLVRAPRATRVACTALAAATVNDLLQTARNAASG